MATAQRRYLSCAETAKLLRKALAAKFPGVRFSVRSSTYSGGASISVSYTDGPKGKVVDALCQLYTGATFDGMQDLKEYHDSMILTPNGLEAVHFGADFIFVSRYYSQSVYADMLARVMVAMDTDDDRKFGFPSYTGRANLGDFDLCWRDGNAHEWTSRLLAQLDLPAAKPSRDDKGGCLV